MTGPVPDGAFAARGGARPLGGFSVVCGVIAYLLILRQRTAVARTITVGLAAAVAVFVGLTRILLGAYWFTDVLAAWLLGAAWLALVITAHRLSLTARRRDGGDSARAARAG